MPIEVYGLWNREAPVLESLHIGELLRGGDPAQVQPGHLFAVVVIVPLLSHLTGQGCIF